MSDITITRTNIALPAEAGGGTFKVEAHINAGRVQPVEDGLAGITDEQVITSLADEFDLTFGEACDLIMRVAENMKVAA